MRGFVFLCFCLASFSVTIVSASAASAGVVTKTEVAVGASPVIGGGRGCVWEGCIRGVSGKGEE